MAQSIQKSSKIVKKRFLILLLTLSTIVAVTNATNDDEIVTDDEDVSKILRQEPFNFANLQRLRSKYQMGNYHRKNSSPSSPSSPLTSLQSLSSSSKMSRKANDQHQLHFDGTDSGQHAQSNVIYEPKDGISFDEYEFEADSDTNLPYGIQNVRRDLTSRPVRRNGQHVNNVKTTFQSLCPFKRTIIPLETISYEYRPVHYEEVQCYHSYAPIREFVSGSNKVCSEAGFTCIQLNRTIHLTRRAKGTDCWESETRIVPSGCECMWPKHNFGDIGFYHQD